MLGVLGVRGGIPLSLAAADLPPPPLGTYPRARKVLEQHTIAICNVLGGDERTAALPPISDDFIPALRADAQGGELSVAAALPLMTTAANIGELEMALS